MKTARTSVAEAGSANGTPRDTASDGASDEASDGASGGGTEADNDATGKTTSRGACPTSRTDGRTLARRAGTAALALGAMLAGAGSSAQPLEPPEAPAHSVARQWNEVLLQAIRDDFARPTVHARNLHHVSAAMYDAWAMHDAVATPVFLGRVQANGERCELDEGARRAWERTLRDTPDLDVSRRVAISHAAHRLILARFDRSPGRADTRRRASALFAALGLDDAVEGTDLAADPSPAVLGNLIAACLVRQGARDGSNEADDFANRAYAAINAPLDPTLPGNPGLEHPNRWQPLELNLFVDQSGNRTSAPFFLGAEWGEVLPFALTADDLGVVERDGIERALYLDPGPPPRLGDDAAANAAYADNFALVALWSAHLDPADGVMLDISPGVLGRATPLPDGRTGLLEHYDALDGGTATLGHPLNPATGEPYAPNLVPRGDYTRVLAEFWADGPDSETPPGHWFRIYNEAVADHPAFERRVEGTGDALPALDFDVRAYLELGGALHDAAIAAWSVKGAYDYVRPVSAIRYLAERGQRSEPDGPGYSPRGLPLVPGRIERVAADDPLAGNGGRNVGTLKVRAWRGPTFVGDPATDTAGVDWILAESWWPYQRPTFVTPPFAGYVSGHSTFSRAAAEVLAALTGDAFFPGGLAEFTAPRDAFLVFEDGPSTDVVLQWATYRDASDQTSLSRIWGGIHPPVDDLPGRRMGIDVARLARARAATFLDGSAPASDVAADGAGGTTDPVESIVTGSGSGCAVGSPGRSSGTPHHGDGRGRLVAGARLDPLLPLALLIALALAVASRRGPRAP